MEDDREYTEAELTGEEETPATPPPPESPGPAAVTPPAEPAPAPPVEPPKAEPTPAPPGEKLPPNALAAIHEERERRKELQRKIEDLERKIAAAPATPPADPRKLITEDPEQAMSVLLQQVDDLRAEIDRRDMEREIKTQVPDFFEKATQMEEYLFGLGFDEEGVKTLIGSAGRNAPRLFKILSDNISRPDEKALRESISAELIPKLTEQITKELMAKFNIAETPTNLSRIPGSGPAGKLNIETEADYAKLPPEQQEKWLSGEL